jgi:hypothetical protein
MRNFVSLYYHSPLTLLSPQGHPNKETDNLVQRHGRYHITTILVRDREILAATAQIIATDLNVITSAVVAVQDAEEGKWAIGDDPLKASNIDHDEGPGTDVDIPGRC